MSTSIRVFVFASVAAGLLPGASVSEESRPPGYVTESYPGAIVTGGFGQCWHTSYWSAESRVDKCDSDTAAVQPPAPAQAQATPAPVVPQPAPEPAAAQEPPPAAPPPAEAAAAPLPAPVPDTSAQAAAQNPRLETALLPQTVHYSTDAFFDFDESTLRPEGRAALDDLVGQLAEVKYGSIRVIGHTDRIGGDDYNMALSERRANAVKNYLARHSVPPNRIEAIGKGKSEPTVKTSTCSGPKSPKVVKCLQPDRRVDIEVAGTKDSSTTGSR